MLRGRRPRGLALPALVVWAGGGERRLEVVGDDPPSVDADGVWRASFTWEFESYVVYGARLVMGDGATVELPSPARGGRSRRHGARRARGGTAAVPLDEVRERAIVEARAEIERERASARHAIAQVEAERERKRQALARGRAELDRPAAALEEERRRLAELRTEVEEERRRLAALRTGEEEPPGRGDEGDERRSGEEEDDGEPGDKQDRLRLGEEAGGRAEIMAGRGSLIESFPLFGQDLDDYDELIAEKLDLLLGSARTRT